MLLFDEGLAEKNPFSSVKQDVLGAVAANFLTFTRTWTLPNHVFITQTRETDLCFRQNLSSLRASLFIEHKTLPQVVNAFAYNAAWDRC